jgi:hypothetical protein
VTTQHPDLPLEQQRNVEYLAKLRTWLEKPVTYGVARNERWVNPNANGHGKTYGAVHPLIGRVGLRAPDEDLGSSFYIGARRFDGDTQTVSWLAPIARAFYRPDDPSNGLFGQIAAIRTFTAKLNDVIDLDEEWFTDPATTSPFAAAELKVSAPSSPAPRSARRRLASPAPTPAAAQPPETAHTDERPKEPQEDDEASSIAGMRATNAVLNRLTAPRSKELVSVLATLQPDQHDLVTRPADQDLIVQGHPGTGKTIVAAYRAGFLITPDDPDRGEHGGGVKNVLLIGPTKGYVEHVSGLLRPFEGQNVGRATVTDLGTFMAEIVRVKSGWTGGLDGVPNDVDAGAYELVTHAADLIRELPRQAGYSGGNDAASRRHDLKRTYDTLRFNGTTQRQIVDPNESPEDIRWMDSLPSFEEAVKLRRWLPLLAQCRMAQWSERLRGTYDHIIVDEAQDVTPIEWSILEQYQHPWKARWTLVGDQNQRRSNVSYTSWQGIAEHLKLNDGAGAEPQIMTRGYRSTNAILKFADGLLGPQLRRAGSIQEAGAPVRVEREPKSKRIWTRALAVASELAGKYEDGTVAIITVFPEQLAEEMASAGWRRPDPADIRTWQLDGITLRIFSPVRARGLEFDAVVVVEPRHYDNDNGRHGQLYTSLTRANRELAVVYHQKLPAGLKVPTAKPSDAETASTPTGADAAEDVPEDRVEPSPPATRGTPVPRDVAGDAEPAYESIGADMESRTRAHPGRALTLSGHRKLAEPAGFGITECDGRIGWALFLDENLLDDGISIGDPVETATSVLTDLLAKGTRVVLSVHADRHDTARAICRALSGMDGVKAIAQRGVLGAAARAHALGVLDDPMRVANPAAPDAPTHEDAPNQQEPDLREA